MTDYSEQEVRQMRDQVYRVPISDKEWQICKAYWLKLESVQWLVEKTKTE